MRGCPGEAEVQQFGTGFRQHDVAGLEVAMDDAAAMGFVESIGYFAADLKGLFERKRSSFEALGEGSQIRDVSLEAIERGGWIDQTSNDRASSEAARPSTSNAPRAALTGIGGAAQFPRPQPGSHLAPAHRYGRAADVVPYPCGLDEGWRF